MREQSQGWGLAHGMTDHHPSQQQAGRQRCLGGVEGELGELMEGLCWFSVKQEVRSSQ